MYQNIKKISTDNPFPIVEISTFKGQEVLQEIKSSHIFKQCIFEDAIIDGIEITGSIFHKCIFKNITFNNGSFLLSQFAGSAFLHVDFTDSDVTDNSFNLTNLSFVKFIGCMINNSRFLKSNVHALSFSDCNVGEVIFDIKLEYSSQITFSYCNEEEAYFVNM